MNCATGPQTAKAQSPSSNGFCVLLQRKCACGSSTSDLNGECEDCREQKLLGIRPKLRVGEPGDFYEREADRMAEQVMRIPGPAGVSGVRPQSPAGSLVQRRVSGNTAGIAKAPPIVQEVLSSPGEPLDAATRAFFEPRFEKDFSRVRIHTDTHAKQSARDLNARAYTVGDHIAFAPSRYSPSTRTGMALIAHELAHVVQAVPASSGPQSQGDSARTFRWTGTPMVLRRSTDEDLGFRSEWYEKTPEERQRILQAGPGLPGYGEIKEMGYQALIESARGARTSCVNLLRESVVKLPVEVQPAARELIDLVDLDLQVIFDVLFLDLGLAVGFGEGVVGAIVGLVKIAYAILDFCLDWILYAFGWTEPFQQDWEDMSLALHNLLSLDVIGLLEAWVIKLSEAPQERKAIMVGELAGEVTALLATWEFSSGKIGRLVPPPLEAPQVVGELAQGGAIAVAVSEPTIAEKLAERLAELGRLGAPRSGGSAAPLAGTYESLMSGKERNDGGGSEPEAAERRGEEDLEEATTEEGPPIVQKFYPYQVTDWGKYTYAGRPLGIVHTVDGPQAWYIRTGGGGVGVPGDPIAGEPARIFGWAKLVDVADPNNVLKWFIKPKTGGRMGVGNEQVYEWLKTGTPPAPNTQITVLERPVDDLGDIKLLNGWLRENGITPGEGYLVGEEISLQSRSGPKLWKIVEIP